MLCSFFQKLDVAILKATSHIEVMPKEKHVQSKFSFLNRFSGLTSMWLSQALMKLVLFMENLDVILFSDLYDVHKHVFFQCYISSLLLFAAFFNAISCNRPRADVGYCLHTLAKRLAKTHTWQV